MLSVKCLAEGSAGNSWLLAYNGEYLILDAGITIKAIKKGVEYNLLAIRGGCISHAHLDHSLAVKDLRDMGLKVFTPYDNDTRLMRFGSFSVQAFEVRHDCPCFGFFIKVGGHKMIYATDYEMIPYSFKKQNLNTMIIEVNYQDKYVDKEASNFDHKILHHCELQTAIKTVNENKTDALQNVIITHMGISSCDANECVEEIKKVVPDSVMVDYAQAGRTWYLE